MVVVSAVEGADGLPHCGPSRGRHRPRGDFGGRAGILEAVGRAYGHTFDLPHGAIGGNAIDAFGTALPPATLELVEASDAVLFGAAGGPKWDDPRATVRAEQGLLTLRKRYDLFANLRPVTVYPELVGASPLRPELLRDVDLVVVRELAGGLYYGKPKRRWSNRRGRRGVDTLSYTESEIVRVLRVAFQLAQGRRKRLASVDKANALETGRLWRELANEVAEDYPDVAVEHILADAASMLLIRDPRRFDVLVAENTFGDILSDEAAVLSGSLGLLPSASLRGIPRSGERVFGLYEPIHGSAPDIAGEGIANPIAAVLSAAMLLRYSLGLETEATAVEAAVRRVLVEGCRCADIAAPGERVIGTREMGEAIAALV